MMTPMTLKVTDMPGNASECEFTYCVLKTVFERTLLGLHADMILSSANWSNVSGYVLYNQYIIIT